ncbi:MAG: ABC transporter ATP-binding protein [Gemmatimonadota bacterium]|nr:ABC transporter ATP-binding protein [Gemmatimonadota bacterium]
MARPRILEVNALDHISFELEEGEVLGVIGRNGAGKSTLLKILSRITAPSSGRALVAGRVASLLEVGTGFHPELTGRENVYLNGMLLGMTRADVDAVFDRICDFAGIGPYISVPIKRYSSGMQLRLAFAVAAHLAADTMIIDEVLAVGDAEFQRKCIGAMRDAGSHGRTTLFVSHNMSAIESMCTQVMWLDRGRVRAAGAPDAVIREYLAAGFGETEGIGAHVELTNVSRRGWTMGMARLHSLTFERDVLAATRPPWRVAFGEAFDLSIDFSLERAMPDVTVWICIHNDRGEDILTSHSADASVPFPSDATRLMARVHIEQPWLLPGTYYVETAVQSGQQLLDCVRESAVLIVEEQSAPRAPELGLKKGAVAPVWQWTLTPERP